MGYAERLEIIKKIEDLRHGTVFVYVTSTRPGASTQLMSDIIPRVHDHLAELKPTGPIDFVLVTNGGDTLAAFGLARLLREFADHISALVPERCRSAGTLFSLGANEIVMTRLATLGPIDPSVTGPLNPAVQVGPGQVQVVPLSVEDIAGFHDLVTTEWGLGGEGAVGAAFQLLGQKVHPLALGNAFRARSQIGRLATTLLGLHRTDEGQVASIVDQLTRQLGSHDYPINRTEAQTLLGSQVVPADSDLESLMLQLYNDIAEDMSLYVPWDPSQELAAAGHSPAQAVQKMALLESRFASDCARNDVTITSVTVQSAPIPQKMIQQEVTFSGWGRVLPPAPGGTQP